METLASRIKRQLQVGKGAYNVPRAPVYEQELKRFWPLDEKNRKAKIALFAKEHGLRLRFYSKGLFAIFDKEPPKQHEKVNNHAAAAAEVLEPVT